MQVHKDQDRVRCDRAVVRDRQLELMAAVEDEGVNPASETR